MKYLLLSLLMLSLGAAAHNSVLENDVDMTLLTPIDKILATPTSYLASPITISGEITAVCKNRGCWAEMIASDGKKLKIKVRDGQTVIPMSARGKQAYATGMLTAIELSKAQATLYLEHMAQDKQQSFDRQSVTAGITIYNLRPTALKIIDN